MEVPTNRFFLLIEPPVYLEPYPLMMLLYDPVQNIVLYYPYQNSLGKDETLQNLRLRILPGFPSFYWGRVLPTKVPPLFNLWVKGGGAFAMDSHPPFFKGGLRIGIP